MQFIKPQDEATIALHKPKDWDDSKGECGTLHVVPIMFAGQESLASLWKPDSEEIKAISEGKPIMLIVCGLGHPPVAMAVAAQEDRVYERIPGNV